MFHQDIPQESQTLADMLDQIHKCRPDEYLDALHEFSQFATGLDPMHIAIGVHQYGRMLLGRARAVVERELVIQQMQEGQTH